MTSRTRMLVSTRLHQHSCSTAQSLGYLSAFNRQPKSG
uniref:Uncharacterized protein n=1 Tax=Anguilla anguilla TaxID=7936 RepID=A0A0E9RZH0_ANGAN